MEKSKVSDSLSCFLHALVNEIDSLPPHNPKEDKHHELELVFIHPPLITLSNILNISTLVDSYVQFTVTMSEDNSKIRTRTPMTNVHGLDIKNNQLVDNIQRIVWEKKSLISQKEFCYKECILRHATEENYVFVDFRKFNSSIKIELVNRVRAKLKNVMAEFKIKYFLGSGSQSKSSMLHALNHPKSKPNTTLEIEILSTEDERPSKEELRDEVFKLSKLLFMGHPDNIFFYYQSPKMYPKTIMLKKQELLTLQLENLYIVGKTDGVTTHVLVDQSGILCYFKHLGYAIKYKCNKKLTGVIELVCEAVKNQSNNTWTLYVIKVIKPSMNDRLSELEFVNEELKNICDRITFKTKKFNGPFTTHTELIESLSKMMEDQPEGVIVFYSKGPKSTLDYKIKKDNTIDLFLNITYRYMSSEPVIFGENNLFLEYKKFANDKGFPKDFGTGKLIISDSVKYLNNLYCISFHNMFNDVGIKTVTVPIKFVGEFSYNGEFIKPRLDKTMQFFTDLGYYGNQYNVVMTHINDQELKINEIFDTDKLADVGKRSQFDDTSRLNQDTAYFTKKRTRGPLGILTNFVKTLLISLYCSKTFMDNTARRKVLAIDFGNGADLEKYFFGEISLMVATDPDARAIETGMERYNKLNAGVKSKYYKFNYIQETIRSSSFVSSVREVFYFGKFDLVDWQLAIHYSFHPKHYSTIMKNLSELTASRGTVLITTMDGDFLETLTEKKTFVIHKDLPPSENFMSLEKIDDSKVLAYSPATMSKPMVEYIVKKNTITRVFSEYGFELIDYVSFYDVIKRSKDFITGVSKLEKRQSTKNFFELNRSVVHSLDSLDVEDLLRYYVVYVFSKR
ncbi:large subunit mRNA capping enzyme [Pteropox virus]|uniref:mRNA-capping enzyme catalytic subunit n=1 Tax=Pteropox virus TaxID=1873698 RepID=A0A1B1MRC8_9POXV|nr:large subunit mRNA capping enzyme [Pteropox virus]ANS71166.1 large subunit mRNA capping enzyme [Pteropox virus]